MAGVTPTRRPLTRRARLRLAACAAHDKWATLDCQRRVQESSLLDVESDVKQGRETPGALERAREELRRVTVLSREAAVQADYLEILWAECP